MSQKFNFSFRQIQIDGNAKKAKKALKNHKVQNSEVCFSSLLFLKLVINFNSTS